MIEKIEIKATNQGLKFHTAHTVTYKFGGNCWFNFPRKLQIFDTEGTKHVIKTRTHIDSVLISRKLNKEQSSINTQFAVISGKKERKKEKNKKFVT